MNQTRFRSPMFFHTLGRIKSHLVTIQMSVNKAGGSIIEEKTASLKTTNRQKVKIFKDHNFPLISIKLGKGVSNLHVFNSTEFS